MLRKFLLKSYSRVMRKGTRIKKFEQHGGQIPQIEQIVKKDTAVKISNCSWMSRGRAIARALIFFHILITMSPDDWESPRVFVCKLRISLLLKYDLPGSVISSSSTSWKKMFFLLKYKVGSFYAAFSSTNILWRDPSVSDFLLTPWRLHMSVSQFVDLSEIMLNSNTLK